MGRALQMCFLTIRDSKRRNPAKSASGRSEMVSQSIGVPENLISETACYAGPRNL
jgi:hypothetical protein